MQLWIMRYVCVKNKKGRCIFSDFTGLEEKRFGVGMEAELKYRETSHYYSNKFMRNSKAVGVLWGIFTVCYAIITIVVFMQVGHNFVFSLRCIQNVMILR